MGVLIVTDGVEDVDAAIVNKFVSADGTKIRVEVNYAHIQYNGASWVVVSTSADKKRGDLRDDLAIENSPPLIGGLCNVKNAHHDRCLNRPPQPASSFEDDSILPTNLLQSSVACVALGNRVCRY